MRSAVADILPGKVRKSLKKLGSDIRLARRKRHLTVLMMAERLGIAKNTYLRIEQGDPTVAMGAYAMTFFALGFEEALNQILDPSRDDQGLLLDNTRLPQRIRVRKSPRPL